MLMGIYLYTIAIQDVRYRGHYRNVAYHWLHSSTCRMSGMMAMLSSEVSLLILTVISLERYLIIAHPYKAWRLTTRSAILVMACVWATGLAITGCPLLVMGKPFIFPNIFYGNNGLCFPLHIHHPYEPGWESSAFIFLGINMTAMLTISLSYLAMFYNIKKTRQGSHNHLGEETVLARRIFWIIFTDALCWIPIFIIKLLALNGVIISGSFTISLCTSYLPMLGLSGPLTTISTFMCLSMCSLGGTPQCHIRFYVLSMCSLSGTPHYHIRFYVPINVKSQWGPSLPYHIYAPINVRGPSLPHQVLCTC